MTEPVANIESPAWAREPVQRLLSNVRQIHEFYHLTIDGLRMIINHHEFLIRADERIQQLTVEVESYGGTVDRNEAEEASEKKFESRQRKGQILHSERSQTASLYYTANRWSFYGEPLRQWSRTL